MFARFLRFMNSQHKKCILYIVINNFLKTSHLTLQKLDGVQTNHHIYLIIFQIFYKIFVSLKVELIFSYIFIKGFSSSESLYIYYSLKWQRSSCPLNITYTFNNLLLQTDPLANVPQSGTIQYSHLTSLSVVQHQGRLSLIIRQQFSSASGLPECLCFCGVCLFHL